MILLFPATAIALQPHPELEINNAPQIIQECVLEETRDCAISNCHAASPIHCTDQCYINAEKKCAGRALPLIPLKSLYIMR